MYTEDCPGLNSMVLTLKLLLLSTLLIGERITKQAVIHGFACFTCDIAISCWFLGVEMRYTSTFFPLMLFVWCSVHKRKNNLMPSDEHFVLNLFLLSDVVYWPPQLTSLT